MNSPQTNEGMEKVQEVITEFFLYFTTEFPLYYRDAVVAKCRAGGKEEGCRLPEASVPEYIIKSGMMYKRGELLLLWLLICLKKMSFINMMLFLLLINNLLCYFIMLLL